MPTLKAKSLNPEYTDREIETGCHSIGFLSFERAIRESLQFNRDNKSKPIGYRITEQGIEIVFN